MTMTLSDLIHPTAVISHDAELASDVQVGPFAIIEGPVTVGPGCIIEGHACLTGPLTMGRDNFVGHGAVLGKCPQSRAYKGERTSVTIGDGNTFREYVTIHRGTVDGGGETRVGDRNLLMISAHLGHDVQVGNGCTLVNCALVGGHAILQDGCILSGHTAVQQRARIGRLAMLGGMGTTTKDIPPFVLQQGYNSVSNLNIVGLRRSGMSTETINALRESFRVLFKEGRSQESSLDRLQTDLGHVPEVVELLTFIRESAIGINPVRDSSRRRRSY